MGKPKVPRTAFSLSARRSEKLNIAERNVPRTRRSEKLNTAEQLNDVVDCGTTIRNEEQIKLALADNTRQNDHGPTETEVNSANSHVPADDINPDISYTNFEFLCCFVSIFSYILDLGSDVYVAFAYYKDGDWWWFGLTLSFIAIPSLIIMVFNLVWYIDDRENDQRSKGAEYWVPRFVLLFLQLGPLLRYVETMIFGCLIKKKPSERKLWHELKTMEETDAAMLRLLECFMEAAPQLTLQLYIITVHGIKEDLYLGIGQIVSCVTSLLSIAWALCAYQRALRLALVDKAKLKWIPMFLMFSWRIFTIGSRVLALAIFASCCSYWMFVMATLHWIIMLIWILCQRTQFCSTRIGEFFFNCVAAFVSIFDFFNLIEGHTRIRYLIYYLLVYAENLIMVVVWYSTKSTAVVWYIIPVMVAVTGLFFVGILLQLVYYLFFHPNNYLRDVEKHIKVCVPCEELINNKE